MTWPPWKSTLTWKSHLHSIPLTYIQLDSPFKDPELHINQGKDIASSLTSRGACKPWSHINQIHLSKCLCKFIFLFILLLVPFPYQQYLFLCCYRWENKLKALTKAHWKHCRLLAVASYYITFSRWKLPCPLAHLAESASESLHTNASA